MTIPNLLPSWKPRSFQKEGVKLGLSQACAGLLFPPGGGKTSTVYMIFRILQDKGYVKKMLVIAPIRPAYIVWPHQKDKFAEFAHFQVNVLHGKDKEKNLLDDDADIYVINPEGLQWLFAKERLSYVRKKFDMLCVDESTKFKNPQTQRFKLIREVVKYFKRRLILTGTITPKGLMDLFGQIYILDEGNALGRYITHYRNAYFYPSGYGGYTWTPGPDADRRIGEKIAPLVIRVELDQIGDELPALIYNDIVVELPPAARAVYKSMEDDLVARLDDPVVAANAAVASGKCRQIANGGLINTEQQTWEVVHDQKLDALEDLIEQLQGEPLLITYEFEFDRERIAERLGVPCISTGNPKHDNKYIQMFSAGMLTAVMGHPQSIALGIDGLQANCHNIAMVGVTWNLELYQQVILRVQRQGNKSKHVFLHRILAKDTVDERVTKVLEDRESNQASFMKLLKELRQ